MALLNCPRCKTQVQVEDQDLGYHVECPRCRFEFLARGEGQPLARTSSDRYDDDPDEDDRPRRRRREADPEELIDDARRAVFLPGLFSIIISALGILLAIGDLALMIGAPQMVKNNPFLGQAPPELLIAARIGAIIWESFLLAGASAMMRLKSLSLARIVMVLRIIPFLGFCCILGFPFGIWGLNVLSKPEVQDGFAEAKRRRDRTFDEDDDR